MKFLKNKFFIIMLCVALALVIVPSVLSIMGLGGYVDNAVMTLTSPLRSAVTLVTDAVEGFTSYFTDYDRLKAENEELKEQLAELEEKYYSIEEIEELNDWLMDYLELAREHTDYDLTVANIVGRETGNYMTVFTLDVGTENGITEDMPVITSDGIVGYITEVGTNWCKVLTILESSSSVGACVEATGDLGLLEGDFEMRTEGLCKLTYLSADSAVAVGDRVISSGLGSIYPRGLVIGYVESVEYDEYSRTITAYVRPSADLENLTRVMVIKSYETVAE
ncbi:MAG: rod shape-determining protein MreC [Firmicutes bacterium]|nr:rod shape-determining protein MreC [Bacillota bacterium]